MSHKLMRIHKFFLVSLFILLSTSVMGQMNMQQHHNHMNQIRLANENHLRMHRTFMNTHMMNSMNRSMAKYSAKYKVTVVSKTGEVLQENKKVKMYFSDPLNELTIKDKKKEYIYRPEDADLHVTMGQKIVRGFQQENHWIFEQEPVAGFEFYSYFPEQGLSYYQYVRRNGGHIEELSKAVILDMVRYHPKAIKDAEKGKLDKALSRFLKDEKQKNKK